MLYIRYSRWYLLMVYTTYYKLVTTFSYHIPLCKNDINSYILSLNIITTKNAFSLINHALLVCTVVIHNA